MLFPSEQTSVKPGTVLIEPVLSGDSLYYYFGCKLNKFNYILKQPKLGSWMSVTAASERGKTPRYEYLPSPNIKISFLALLRATISP